MEDNKKNEENTFQNEKEVNIDTNQNKANNITEKISNQERIEEGKEKEPKNIINENKADEEGNDGNYVVEREYSIESIHNLILKDEIKEEKKEEKKEEINKISIEPEQLKCNIEYKDNNDDLVSRRLSTKHNNDKYLIIKEEDKTKSTNKNKNNNDNNASDSDYESDKEEEKKNLFPFRIMGDAEKKSQKLGIFNSRYLEIDSIKGLFKRYKTSKDYPKKPNDVVDLRNLQLLRKLKSVKNYYDLELTYTVMKKGEKIEKVEYYRLKNSECRNKWFNLILQLWKYLIKGTPVLKFTNKILLFIDDKIGIIQEIKENKIKDKGISVNLKSFKILGLLGVGGFGTVFKVKHILTGKIYAMKVMNKNYLIKKKYLHYVISEFEIMKKLSGFPFILDLHYSFQSANYLYLVIDYCPNGDFKRIKSINNIKLFIAEVILAIDLIHKRNIIYRDLKPNNILLDSSGHICICDFNLAKTDVPKDKRADSFCGSPMYLSPEMLSGKGVDYRCDIYGIGLLMYELVTGSPAFIANDIQSLYELIRTNNIDYKSYDISEETRDLLVKILVKNPEERISLEEMKKHPYFKFIDFNKVLRKEYGPIITEKESKAEEEDDNNLNEEKLENRQLIKFKLQQQKLDENKKYSILDGKITVKEMIKDQKRVMKNYVREFYFIKKEDFDIIKELQLKYNESLRI